jgi:predicted secreted protein
MTASAAVKGYGTILYRGTKTSGTAIVEIADIGDFGSSRADIDITSHDSDNTAQEYMPGMIDGGELTITGNLIVSDTSGSQTDLFVTAIEAGTVEAYQLVLPTDDTFTFNAFVKSYKIKGDLKGVNKITMTLRVTGTPTFAVV